MFKSFKVKLKLFITFFALFTFATFILSCNSSQKKRLKSLAHPLVADVLTPLTTVTFDRAVRTAPFLIGFAGLRYVYWMKASVLARRSNERSKPHYG